MRDQDYRWNADKLNDPEDELDRVLNAVLATYGRIEAREGLELRILANLRAQDSRPHSQWWGWGLAAAVLAIVIVTIAWRFGGHTRSFTASRPAVPQTSVERAAQRNPSDRIRGNTAPVRIHATRKTAPGNPNPKLDQFPSPRPMSEQERILAMYINQDPKHAALIAEARMEALRQDEAEKMRAASPED